MKPIFSFCLFIFSLTIFAQDFDEKYMDKVQSLDITIETLYGVISGEKGEERNWELFSYLFKPEAQLIPTGIDKEGVSETRYMSVENYIEVADSFLKKGFFEIEIHRTVDTFGNITHVFSTYESYRSASDTIPFMRGINSIQLLYDSKRWWIVNIYWMQETDKNPISKKYLKN